MACCAGPAMSAPKLSRVAWVAIGMMLLGAGAYWHAASLASLSMVYCHNHYELSAADWECRRVGYYAWSGIGLFVIGVAILLVRGVGRLFVRR